MLLQKFRRYSFNLFNFNLADKKLAAFRLQLNFSFVDGYYYFPKAAEDYLGGSFDAWAIRNGVIKGALVPEIPGKLAQEKKNKVVDLFFRRFLVK